MPDEPDDMRVQVARLDGRLEGVERGLARQEEACERRAAGHVDRELYFSERDGMRKDITDNDAAITELRAAVENERRDRQREREDAEKQRQRDRRWWIASVAIPLIGVAVAVVGWLT